MEDTRNLVSELAQLKTEMINGNREAELLNNRARDSKSKAEILASQFDRACKSYKEKYGVDVSRDNLLDELRSVLDASKSKLNTMVSLISLINEGRIDEANALAGIESPIKSVNVATVATESHPSLSAETVISSSSINTGIEKVQVPVSVVDTQQAPPEQTVYTGQANIIGNPITVDPNILAQASAQRAEQSVSYSEEVQTSAPVEQKRPITSMEELSKTFNASLNIPPAPPTSHIPDSAGGKLKLDFNVD